MCSSSFSKNIWETKDSFRMPWQWELFLFFSLSFSFLHKIFGRATIFPLWEALWDVSKRCERIYLRRVEADFTASKKCVIFVRIKGVLLDLTRSTFCVLFSLLKASRRKKKKKKQRDLERVEKSGGGTSWNVLHFVSNVTFKEYVIEVRARSNL